jgi:hypothetical protein
MAMRPMGIYPIVRLPLPIGLERGNASIEYDVTDATAGERRHLATEGLGERSDIEAIGQVPTEVDGVPEVVVGVACLVGGVSHDPIARTGTIRPACIDLRPQDEEAGRR